MIQHSGPISGIATYKSDFIATAGYDNRLILWDASRKRAIACAFHDHLANQCAFSFCGRYLVSSSSDHTARLWDIPSLKLRAVLSDQTDDVEMSAIHPTKPLIAPASRDHCVRIYNFEGELIHRLKGHKADVISVDWIQDRDEVVSSSDDGTMKRWSAKTGELLSDMEMDGVETDTLAVSNDGIIYAGNDKGEIVLVSGDRKEIVQAHNAGIKRLVLNAQCNTLISLSYDRTFKIWQVRSGLPTLLTSARLPDVVWPRSCAFLGDSSLVFGTMGSSYATYDYRSKQWDVSEIQSTPGINAVIAYDGTEVSVGDAGVVLRDGKPVADLGSLCNFLTAVGSIVVTGGQNGQLFDALSGRLLHQHRSPLNCAAAFIKDGATHVIVGCYTGEALVLRIQEEKNLVYITTIQLHANAIKGVAVTHGVIFSVCADTSAAFHSTVDFMCLDHMPGAHEKIANGCIALADGSFASISRDRKLRIWRSRQPSEVATPHTHSIKCIAASSDGNLLATGSYNGLIAIFHVGTARWTTVERPTVAGISSLAYNSFNGQFLASSYDSHVYRIMS